MVKKGENQPQPQPAPKRQRIPRKKKVPDDSFLPAFTNETDYYKILGVSRNASTDEVREAFMTLAKIWHPDKHLGEQARAEAEVKFKEINQANQILSDPEQRRNYDAYHGWITDAGIFNTTMFGFGSGSGTSRRTEPELPIVYTPVECSLEELYHGTTKNMKVSTAVANPSLEETVQVNIEPGYEHGAKLTYCLHGDHRKRVGYVIEEKRHPVFERERHDLIVHQEITLLEALTGGRSTLDLTTLDGRKLMVPLADDVIRAHGDEMVVPGEGMPISKQPGMKGDLRIKFNVKFPTSSLTAEQKLDLRKGLEGVSS